MTTCDFCGKQEPDEAKTLTWTTAVENGRLRRYCDECLPEHRAEKGQGFADSAHAALARLRAEGRDPGKRPEVRAKVGRANARRRAEELAWDAEHERPDPEQFRREVLPAIQGVPLSRLASASGLSVQQCGVIRRGLAVPHARHWDGFRAAASAR